MRAVLLGAMLLTVACRPDPLSAALAVPKRTPPVARVASAGDPIVVEVLRPPLRVTTTISASGALAIPICGDVSVAGQTASQLCPAVAGCLEQVFRRAAVRVTLGEEPSEADRAGCDVVGPPKPEGHSAPARAVLAAATEAARMDGLLLSRAAEAAASLEALDVELTGAHPEAASLRTRIERLLAAAPVTGSAGDGSIARRTIDPALASSESLVAQLQAELGPRHPDLRRALATRDFLRAMSTALPSRDSLTTAATREVERIELEAELAYHTGTRGLGAKHPQVLSARARLAELAAIEDPAATCAERSNAFELRIAHLQGQRRHAPNAGTVDAALDALAMARAQLRASQACRCLADRSPCGSASQPPAP